MSGRIRVGSLREGKAVSKFVREIESQSPALFEHLNGGESCTDIEQLARAVILALREPDAEIRRVAVQTIGLLADSLTGKESRHAAAGEAISALTGALAAPDASVRVEALVALGCFVPLAAPDLVTSVARMVDDATPEIKRAGLDTLSALGPYVPFEVVAALIDIVKNYVIKDDGVAVHAMGCLEACGQDAVAEATGVLADMVQDSSISPQVRLAACRLLQWLGADASGVLDALTHVVLQAATAPAEMEVRVEAGRVLVGIPDVVAVIAPRLVQAGQRAEFLSILRRVGSDATVVRLALESDWRGEHPPAPAGEQPPAAPPVESPAQATSSDVNSNQLAELKSNVAELTQLVKSQLANDPEREWFTISEVAERTDYKEWTIRQACNRKRITAEKDRAGKWRISKEVLAQIRDQGLPK